MFATIPEKGMNLLWSKQKKTFLSFLTTHQHLNKFTVYKLNKRPIQTNKSSDCMII